MKIAVITHAHFAITQPFAGGLEAHTFHLVRELIRQGHDVTTYAKNGTDLSLNPKLSFVGNAHGGNSSRYNASFRLTMNRIRLGHYDLIINNSLNHIPLRLHTNDMPPMITIFHTPPLPQMEKELRKPGLHSNRAYIAVSELTASQWHASCDIEVNVVDNGIDTSDWVEYTNSPNDGTQKVAVWSGRITPEKGTHMAIEACRRIGIHLIIAGSKYDTAYFESFVKPTLGEKVEYVGHVDQTGLQDLYKRADLALVTPLWDEPFGLVAIEALASGVPVAALPNGALPSIVSSEVGSVAEDVTSESLALAIQNALQIERTACRPYVESRFTLERMVGGYLKYAEELMLQPTNELKWQTYP